MTPEEVAQQIVESIPYERPEIIDEAALIAVIAAAIRDTRWQCVVATYDPSDRCCPHCGAQATCIQMTVKGPAMITYACGNSQVFGGC